MDQEHDSQMSVFVSGSVLSFRVLNMQRNLPLRLAILGEIIYTESMTKLGLDEAELQDSFLKPFTNGDDQQLTLEVNPSVWGAKGCFPPGPSDNKFSPYPFGGQCDPARAP